VSTAAKVVNMSFGQYVKKIAKIMIERYLHRSGLAATQLIVMATPTNVGRVRRVQQCDMMVMMHSTRVDVEQLLRIIS